MKTKQIYSYISIILILIIFLIFWLYGTNNIEYFEDATTNLLESRVNSIEKKYGELIPSISKEIGDRITKYDKMYTWYENKLATDTAAAQLASAEAQAQLKDAKPNDPSTAGKITDSLSKGAAKTGDEDNINSVNKSIKEQGPPDIKTSSSTNAMLNLYG